MSGTPASSGSFSESGSIAGTPAGLHGLSRHLSFIGTPAESPAHLASYHRGGLAVLARAAVAIGSQPIEPIDATSARAPCQVSTPSSLLSSADHSVLEKRRLSPSLASASDGDDSDSSSSSCHSSSGGSSIALSRGASDLEEDAFG